MIPILTLQPSRFSGDLSIFSVMAPQNTMLSEVIGKLSKKSCFTLRVVRLWRVPLRNKPEVARTVDMVLQDTNGMRIQATIDRFELIEKYNDSIVEHGVYLMKNFNVTPNTSGWRPTSHAFKLHFNETTIVSENVAVDYPAFPMDLYHFKTVEQVLQTPSPNEAPDLIDFIGALVHTEKVYLSESAGSNMLTFHLLDSGNQRIHVTLWGEYADQAKGVLYTRRKSTIIVLLQFCRISRKKDTSIGLATSFHVTKLLIDEHIPEMEDFRYSFMAVNEASSQFSGSTTNLSNGSGSPGPIISDISKLLVVKEVKGYWFYGILSSILSKDNWFYQACPDTNCLKKVEACADEYKCCSCNKKTLSPTLRYRLKVEIRDNTSLLIAMMWDELCRNLFSKSAAKLAISRISDKNSTDLPDEILRSQGKGYIFKVSGYQGSGGGRVYNISALCSDPVVINLHKPAHHDSSSEESDSDDDLHIMMPNTKKQILMWYILDSPIELDGEPDEHERYFTPSSKRQCDEDCDGDGVGPNTQCSTTKKLKSVKIEKL
ncbi:hypothetical protein OROHE_018891 [Orobanche hederae]